MSDAMFAAWTVIVGQIMTLAVMIWNKWEQRKQGEIVRKTYALTNSAFGTLATTAEISARRLAEITREAGDAVLADAAQRLAKEHAAKQTSLDAKESKPPSP